MATSEQMKTYYADHPDVRAKISAGMTAYHQKAGHRTFKQRVPAPAPEPVVDAQPGEELIRDYLVQHNHQKTVNGLHIPPIIARIHPGERFGNVSKHLQNIGCQYAGRGVWKNPFYEKPDPTRTDERKQIKIETAGNYRCKNCRVKLADQSSYFDHIFFCKAKTYQKYHTGADVPGHIQIARAKNRAKWQRYNTKRKARRNAQAVPVPG